jgi:hypothetical protein
MMRPQSMQHSVQSHGLADVLERVLDKGLVIAGDIKIKLVDIELLTIQIRLLIASVDKAKEMGIDWWTFNPELSSKAHEAKAAEEIAALKARIQQLENLLTAEPPPPK